MRRNIQIIYVILVLLIPSGCKSYKGLGKTPAYPAYIRNDVNNLKKIKNDVQLSKRSQRENMD